MKCMCTVFAMLLTFISVTAPIAASEADWMPDANLRTAVRSALSIADDAALTKQNMENLTSFAAQNSQISNITGLEYATELTSLDVRDNTITVVTPLSTLTDLEELRLKGNTVSDISALSNLTSLTLLNLKENSISDISSLSGLTNLEHLKIDSNSITDVRPLLGLTNLKRLWIASNELTNAHLLSSLTNLTTIDIEIPDPPDTTAPDVSISVPSDVQNGAFDAIITFTEAVSSFDHLDVSLSGTATASITSFTTSDNTAYTATIRPTSDGTVILDVAADVATDAANNPNTAATPKTVTVTIADPQEPIVAQQQRTDTVAPDVSISVPLVPQNSAFDVIITFTEAVSGFEQADVSLGGTATASITDWHTTDNTVFTAEITPTTSGEVTLDIAADVATDAASNGNTVAATQTVTVELGSSAVLIPNANLATAIRTTLGLAADADITEADMQQLTQLSAAYRRVSDLTGLERATNLTWLDLRGNNLSDISALAELTSLMWLDLANTEISDISALAELTSLKTLYLRDNQISDISALASLTSLTTLHLANTEISDISALASLTSLTKLDLMGTEVIDISPLASLTSLTELYLRDNQISDISALASLTSLTWLFLRNNEISDISPLASLTSLTFLFLSDNTISDISALASLASLTWLNLNFNEISDISPLASLTSLEILFISSNLILDTSPIYPLLDANGGSLTVINIRVSQYPPWDVNKDGSVDAADSALVTAALGETGDGIVNKRTDVNKDGTVDADDLTLVTDNLDTDAGAPSGDALFTLIDPQTLASLDPETLQAQLDILQATSDGSLKYLRAIAWLETILEATRPEETVLLANYPNPFNPETWIPYQLAAPSNVRITIYDARGILVRQLDLGHQREGYYTSRSRAAYWDGRNDFGERVASGIYFYQFQADNMSLLRKMLILK